MVQQVNVFEHKCSEYASLVDFLRQEGIRAKCPDTSPMEHILDILGCRVQQTPALKQFATAVNWNWLGIIRAWGTVTNIVYKGNILLHNHSIPRGCGPCINGSDVMDQILIYPLAQGVNSVTVRGDSLWKLSMMLYENGYRFFTLG